jgi:hypothetical protein
MYQAKGAGKSRAVLADVGVRVPPPAELAVSPAAG